MTIDIYDEARLYRTLEAYIGKVIDFTTEISRAFGGSGMHGTLEKSGQDKYALKSYDKSCVLIFHIESVQSYRTEKDERLFLDLNI